jgi:hypothetical protein
MIQRENSHFYSRARAKCFENRLKAEPFNLGSSLFNLVYLIFKKKEINTPIFGWTGSIL